MYCQNVDEDAVLIIVSLTSGLPMVRQGLRSLQNGHASLPHYPPPSPINREAERREAGKPARSRNPGSRGVEKRPGCRLGLGQADPTKPPVRLIYITGMPRSLAACRGIVATWRKRTWRHVATRASRVLSSLFSSQSFAFAKPTHHPTLTATF